MRRFGRNGWVGGNVENDFAAAAPIDPLHYFGTEEDYLAFLASASRSVRSPKDGLAVLVATGGRLYEAPLPSILIAPNVATVNRLGERLVVEATFRSGQMIMANVYEGESAVPYAEDFIAHARAYVEPALSESARQLAQELTQ